MRAVSVRDVYDPGGKTSEVVAVKTMSLKKNGRVGRKHFTNYVEALPIRTRFELSVAVDLVDLEQYADQLGWDRKQAGALSDLPGVLRAAGRQMLEEEREFYADCEFEPARQFCDDLLREDTIPLQVGYGSGWRGMTGNLVDTTDRDVRCEYDMATHRLDWPFPKSRKIACKRGTDPEYPLGWLALEPIED
jgi:hypothetical protein